METNDKNSEHITCLFEDGNVHVHNQASYQKMKEHQEMMEKQQQTKRQTQNHQQD